MKEKLYSIPRFNKNYLITKSGKVWSNYSKKYLSPCKNKKKNGYLMVNIYQKNYTIHRLMKETFIKNKNKKLDINHKNGIKIDNRLSNLELCSRSQNMKHAFKLGLIKHLSKARFNARKKVIQLNNENKVIKIWNGITNAENKLGIKQSYINQYIKGKKKTAGGYKWKLYNV